MLQPVRESADTAMLAPATFLPLPSTNPKVGVPLLVLRLRPGSVVFVSTLAPGGSSGEVTSS